MKASHLIVIPESELNRLRKVANFFLTEPNSQHSLPVQYWVWLIWGISRLWIPQWQMIQRWSQCYEMQMFPREDLIFTFNLTDKALKDWHKFLLCTLVSELLLTLKMFSSKRDTINCTSVSLVPPCWFLLLCNASEGMWIVYPFSVSTVACKNKGEEHNPVCELHYIADTNFFFLNFHLVLPLRRKLV